MSISISITMPVDTDAITMRKRVRRLEKSFSGLAIHIGRNSDGRQTINVGSTAREQYRAVSYDEIVRSTRNPKLKAYNVSKLRVA